MSEVSDEDEYSRRRKRIDRLKKIIVRTILALIIIPTVTCIILIFRNRLLSHKVDELREKLNYSIENPGESISKAEPSTESGEVLAEEDSDSLEPLYVEWEISDEELFDGYRKVYLTFDDGPSANTSEILDILKEYNVKATFFVVRHDGLNYEELYQRIVDEGHSLGMHSSSHVYSEVYASVDAFANDTKELRDFLYMVTGVESNIYRFPGGSTNRVSQTDMKLLADELEKEGIIYFDWNVSSGDASSVPLTKEEIVENATSGLEDLDEAVILFHDLGSKTSTVEALPEIIEYIESLDKTVILPITDETRPVRHLSSEDE
jgi:peptidoglycan-N-acetylglucosamine deacetylase